MPPQSIDALLERIATAERAAEAARAEVAELRQALRRYRHRPMALGLITTTLILSFAVAAEWRVAYAQSPLGGYGVIQAPLMVRGKSGVIFSVQNNDGGLAVVDPASGTPIALLGLQTPGTQTADGKLAPAISGLTVFGLSGKPIVKAFRNPAGNGSVAVQDQNDEQLDAVFGVGDGGPAVALKASGGVEQLKFGVFDGKPWLEFHNSANVGVARLAGGPGGAGQLRLGNPNGDSVVEAGLLEGGRGIVRVYPWRGTTPGMLFGLSGTYIVGSSQGAGK
jgi:hypothetical protein